MRQHINLYYKSYDGEHKSEMERLMNERFNDYGYNFESNQKKECDLDAFASKSGPYCLRHHNNSEKR